MFLAMMCLLLVGSVPACGGRLNALTGIRWRGVWLLVAALLVQILVISVWTSVPHVVAASAHVGTYAAAAWFVWCNRSIAGLWLLALGTSLNGAVIALNGGTLPASVSALRRTGMHIDPKWSNSGPVVHPHLAWLGDIVATPGWLPLRNVLSIGDVIILVGAAVMLHVVCRSRPAVVLAGLAGSARARLEGEPRGRHARRPAGSPPPSGDGGAGCAVSTVG